MSFSGRSSRREKIQLTDDDEVSLDLKLSNVGYNISSAIYVKIEDRIIPLYVFGKTYNGYDVFIYIDNSRDFIDDRDDVEIYDIFVPDENPLFARDIAKVTKDRGLGAIVRCYNGYYIYNHMAKDKFIFVGGEYGSDPKIDYSKIPVPIIKLSDIIDGDSIIASQIVTDLFKIFVRRRYDDDKEILGQVNGNIDKLKDLIDSKSDALLNEIEDAFESDQDDDHLRNLFSSLDDIVRVNGIITTVINDIS